MRRIVRHIVLGWIISGVVLLNAGLVYGQLTKVPTPIPTKESTLNLQDKMTIATLRDIVQTIEALEEQLNQKQAEFEAVTIEEQKTKIATEIDSITAQIDARYRDFEAIATGVDLDAFEAKPQKIFDWRAELQEIFGPILDELKDLTARPRELERLRNEAAYYEKRLPIIKSAIERLQQRINQATAQKLKRMLGEIKQRWEDREKAFSTQLSVVKYQLEEKEKNQQSFVKSTQALFRQFFKSRGRNLVLSLLAFIAVLLIMRYLYRLINKVARLDQTGKRPFFLRLADVIYLLLTFLGATSALLLVLYISGDWVLLGLALIFLFGIAWTAQQAFPMFWEQIKLLLNLSTVREGERVIYNGLPWHVKSLNLYTKLHNPALKGGLIRLPLRELVGLHSRPFHKDEPWFPCREQDLVVLADGTVGTVVMQTPEQVILEKLGGSDKTYTTLEFLGQSPDNLSINTFGVFITFGVDYAHQAIVTREIPETLQGILKEDLQKENFGQYLTDLTVQFTNAGASSLDLYVGAFFSGAATSSYYVIPRTIQRIAVEACNQHGWGIPFMQVTVHQAGSAHPNHNSQKGTPVLDSN